MKIQVGRTVVHLLGLGLLCAQLASGAVEPRQDAPRSQCCFAREGYQGLCKIQPGEGETCESILEYLNTPGTVGKTYCGGSTLRGGWKLVDCSAR